MADAEVRFKGGEYIYLIFERLDINFSLLIAHKWYVIRDFLKNLEGG